MDRTLRRHRPALVLGLLALGLAACSAAPSTSVAPVADAPSAWTPQAARPSSGPSGAPSEASTPSPGTASVAASRAPRPLLAPPPSGVASPAARTGPGGPVRTAAARYGWTKLIASDDFTGTRPSTLWHLYDSVGHNGKGIRSPGQISVRDGVLRIVGTKDGTTGGMSWDRPRKYGRWETRVRVAPGCGCYHPVLILWPTEVEWPAGGEIDYAEVTKDPQRRLVKFFLHHGASNAQLRGQRSVDLTTWHTFAVEWTPGHVNGYVDGVRWFRTTRTDVLPPGPMHQTIQLDWFPEDGAGGTGLMEVDWVRMYAL